MTRTRNEIPKGLSLDEWVVHRCGDVIGPALLASPMLVDIRSPFQRIRILRNRDYGRVLVLDDDPQLSSTCEQHYHEVLVWPAMLLAKHRQRIFVAGGGDGGVAREVLKFPGVKSVLVAELDRQVIDLCRKHLRIDNGALVDSRVSVAIGDAVDALQVQDSSFDCIVSDLTSVDTSAPASTGYSASFFRLVSRRLSKGGIFATQLHSTHPLHMKIFHRIETDLRECFASVCTYHAFVPLFGTTWGFCVASNDPLSSPTAGGISSRLSRLRIDLEVHNAESLGATFLLPKYLQLCN
jgi:spermidine synthase